MLRAARIVGIGMNADRTRSGWKTAALLLAGMALSAAGIAYAAAFSDDDKAVQTTQKAQAKDAPDPVTLALKAAVRNGSISEERAIQVYSLLTDGLPGSNREAKTEAYLEQAATKLDAMVSAGKLSAEDAEAKMIALENQIAIKEERAFKMESGDKSATDAYLEQVGRLVLTNCDAFDTFPPCPFTAIFAVLRGPKSIGLMLGQMQWKALRHSPLGFGLLATNPDPALTVSWLEPCRTDSRIRGNLAKLLRHVSATDLTDVST